MRIYTFAPGDIPKVLDGWSKAIEAREKFSPLAACWTSELGGLNKFVHTWVYKDLNERVRVREAARTAGGPWLPQTGVRPIRQENTDSPGFSVKCQHLDIVDVILWLILRPSVVYQREIKG